MAEKTDKKDTNWKEVVTHIVNLLRAGPKADPMSSIGANNQRLDYANAAGAADMDPTMAASALRTWQANPYGPGGAGGVR